MVISTNRLNVTWEKLPDDYVLDDDPVDNINQPALAAALTESLEIAGRLPQAALTSTNYAICATLDGRIVVKAPDWSFVPAVRVARDEVIRSYTPMLQGELPLIVMEFLSDTEGGEYSIKPTYPPGKWFFYEQVLKIPTYALFDPSSSLLEVYRLDEAGRYQPQTPNEQGQFWITEMSLYLGVWQGTRENRTGPWLRWWDQEGQLLLWGGEKAAQEYQRAEQERQRAEQERQQTEQERQRAERLAAQLRAAGIEPES